MERGFHVPKSTSDQNCDVSQVSARDDQEFSLDSDASSSRENLTPPTAKVFKHSDPLDDAIFIKRQGIYKYYSHNLKRRTVEPLYNGHLWGTVFWPLYRGAWPLLRGCFVHKLFIGDLGVWPLYSSWPLFGGSC